MKAGCRYLYLDNNRLEGRLVTQTDLTVGHENLSGLLVKRPRDHHTDNDTYAHVNRRAAKRM